MVTLRDGRDVLRLQICALVSLGFVNQWGPTEFSGDVYDGNSGVCKVDPTKTCSNDVVSEPCDEVIGAVLSETFVVPLSHIPETVSRLKIACCQVQTGRQGTPDPGTSLAAS